MSEGFANHETFTVAVTLENDRAHAEHLRRIVTGWAGLGLEAFELAERLKRYVEELAPIDDAGGVTPEHRRATVEGAGLLELLEGAGLLAGALCTAALARVDWLELAQHWSRRYLEEGGA